MKMDANTWDQKMGGDANSPRKPPFLLMNAVSYLTCICAKARLGIAHLIARKNLTMARIRVRNT